MRQPPGRTRIHQGGKRLIDPYKEYLGGRWNEGCRSAQQRYREIKEQGDTGSSTAVGRFVAPLRAHTGKARSAEVGRTRTGHDGHPRGSQAETASHRSADCSLDFKEEQRLEWQQSYLTQLCENDLQIAQTYELIQAFTSMLRERAGERLDEWLERVENQGVVELQSFAQATQEGL
jgi:transposase